VNSRNSVNSKEIVGIATAAGDKILEVYASDDFSVEAKADDSPLTKADLASHEHIATSLKILTPDIPVLSEESQNVTYRERSKWSRFWLVDPLDGTKEFIKRNGEFTVNIALVENGKVVLGVVHTPALGVTYFAARGEGAFKQENGSIQAITAREEIEDTLEVVASRSHAGPETQTLLENLAKDYQVNLVSKGSALKLCLVAEGAAHFYPRLGPTMEWDTAAAQCVVEEAGAVVTDVQGDKLKYNKENLLNPFFMVSSVGGNWWQQYLRG
jgi:3'(2'), 5'-bisphosphate nucleotidase